MSDKGTKAGRFFTPGEEITLTKEKEQRKKKEEARRRKTGGDWRKKKAMDALLVFIMPTLFDGRGPFGSNRFSEIQLEL